MPGMDNWVDLGSFRARFPDTRLVVVSGSRRREDILRALSIGANGFIHKGAGVIELSRAIKTICDGHVYVPAFLPEHPGEEIGLFETSDHSAGAAPFPDLDTRANHGLAPTGFEGLACTARQREVILLLISGHSNKSMARVLGLSEGTIKFHMSAVLRLLGVASRVEAATRAMKLLNRTTD